MSNDNSNKSSNYIIILGVFVILCIVGFTIFKGLNKKSKNNNKNENDNKVTVVNFALMPELDRKKWCEDNNINCVIERKTSDEYINNYVISQSVEKGSTINKGDKITIVVSDGMESKYTTQIENDLAQYAYALYYSKYSTYESMIKKGYKKAEIDEEVKKMNINWNMVALFFAQRHYKPTASIEKYYSKYELNEVLVKYSKFTEEEAKYAIENINVDWKEIAYKAVEYDVKKQYQSKKDILNLLTTYSHFDDKEVEEALNKLNVDFKEVALNKAKEMKIYGYKDKTKEEIYNALSSPYGLRFTEEEAKYAIDHLED